MADTVYVLTNQAMPGIGKMGMTDGPIEVRMRQLDSTGVPFPFECFSAWEVDNASGAEKALHIAFGDHRLRDRREFFRISPDKPTAILKQFGSRDVTPGDDIVVEDENAQDDLKALEKARSRKPNFTFEMVGLGPGEILNSIFDENVTCEVADNKKVLFGGELKSLSQAAVMVAHDNGRKWKNIAGPLYWKYDDQTLSELRDRSEDED